MRFYWLNKQNNKNLLVFFVGWSFDFRPFEFLDCENYDVLIIYDYSNIIQPKKDFVSDLPKLINVRDYEKSYLVAWSMGVFTAFYLRDILPEFTKKIAINGTVLPVDNEYGIPLKPFLLTLKHAKIGLEGKFYQNIFDKQEEFEEYIKNPVERTIQNRVEELQNLYEKIKNYEQEFKQTKEEILKNSFKFYDSAIISKNDKIIPPANQLNFWKSKAQFIDSGHFPYYNFKSWNEIICK